MIGDRTFVMQKGSSRLGANFGLTMERLRFLASNQTLSPVECCDRCYSWHPLRYAHYPLHHAHQQSPNTLTSCAPTRPQELLAKVHRALPDYVASNSYNPCCFLPFPHIPPLFPLSLAPRSLCVVFAVISRALPVSVRRPLRTLFAAAR